MEVYDVDPYPIGWYFVAFSDEVEALSVSRVHYFGQELVLYRGESGAVHTTEAFCAHQGAHLGWGGKVQGTTSSARSTDGGGGPTAPT